MESRTLLTAALTQTVTATPVINETITPQDTDLTMSQFNASTAPGATVSNPATFLGAHVDYATDAHIHIESTVINPANQPVVNGLYTGTVTTTLSVPGQSSFPGSALMSMVTQPTVNFIVQPGPGTKTDGSDGRLEVLVDLTNPMSGSLDLTPAQANTAGYVGTGAVQDPSFGLPHAIGTGVATFTEAGGGNETAMTTKFAHTTATLSATYFYFVPGTISGLKFNDANNSGGQDNGEGGLSGITINLTGTADELDKPGGGLLLASTTVNLSTTTSSAAGHVGEFSFSNLRPGTYTITEVVPSGQVQTFPGGGSYTITIGANGVATVGSNTGNNFGDFTPNPGILIKKFANGQDSTPAQVTVGTQVTFTYDVSNTGDVPLHNVVVVDDNATPGNNGDDFNPTPVLSNGFNSGDTNHNNILDLTETWHYTASTTALLGLHDNVATVTGLSPQNSQVTNKDDASYTGQQQPSILIKKFANGQDSTPAQVAAGSQVTFTYDVSNTGNVALHNVVVTDDNATPGNTGDDFNPAAVLSGGFNSGDANHDNILDLTETWHYTASTIALAGLHDNIATVTGLSPANTQVTATDDASYTAQAPAILIKKFANGQDSTPAQVQVGSQVTFTYNVSNTGNVPLHNVVLIDDDATPGNPADDFNPTPVLSNGFNSGDTNHDNVLDLTETWNYTATTTALLGTHTNVGTVTGLSPQNTQVTSNDNASYTAQEQPALLIKKYANGLDSTPVQVAVGSQVTFTYDVTNPGNVALHNVVVVDDNATPGNTGDDFNPTPVLSGGFNSGDINHDNILDLTETWHYTAAKTALAGLHDNIAKATGLSPANTQVMATDDASYTGQAPSILIKKYANGQDSTPVQVAVGSQVTFTYDVSNPGNVPLHNVVVVDDNATPGNTGDDFNPVAVLSGGFNSGDTNHDNILDLTETWHYTATTTALAGTHNNVGTVSGLSPTNAQVTSSDNASYAGQAPSIQIIKYADGQDSTSVVVPVGTFVTFTYDVKNTGNVPLHNVVVVDDNATPGNTADDFNPTLVLSNGFNSGDTNHDNILDLNETWHYTATTAALAGVFNNVAKVTGSSPLNTQVMDTDDASYTGQQPQQPPSLLLKKYANCVDDSCVAVRVGCKVTYTYNLTNTGQQPLTNVVIVDDNATPGNTADDFHPNPVKSNGFNTGDTNHNGTLDPGETWHYTFCVKAQIGEHDNTAVATATSPANTPAQSSDTACYIGVTQPPSSGTICFWHTKCGAAVINSDPNIGNDLAVAFPNLFGAGAAPYSTLNSGPVHFVNLMGQSSANVYAAFMVYYNRKDPRPYAQVMATMLAAFFDSNPTPVSIQQGSSGDLFDTAIKLKSSQAAALGLPQVVTVSDYLAQVDTLLTSQNGVIPSNVFTAVNDVANMINNSF